MVTKTKTRLGNQRPTQSVTLHYAESLAHEAIELYQKTGRSCYPWQVNLLEHIMGIDTEGLWVHQKYGYAIPRRNGKTEDVYMLELWALHHGLKILHTAHRISTSHSSFEALKKLLEDMGYVDDVDFVSNKAKGQERIEFKSTGSVIQYRTRTANGGLGEGFDLLIIDEAQEYTAEQESALKYTVTDSDNPMTVMCGTPPTMVSIGYWPSFNQKSAISENEWKRLEVEAVPELTGKLFVGIKYGQDGANVSMAIAARTDDKKIFTEVIDCQSVRNGMQWIINFLQTADIEKVVVDGANGQTLLANEMKDFKLRKPIMPTVSEIITANSVWEQAIVQETLRHANQPSLTDVVTNCDKRNIGSNGGFGYKSLYDDRDISLMDSALLAHWACYMTKPKRKQRISY
ncbi:terminase [Streptococcus suis]|uniref:DEAD/DEAH box helicase family protein n=1 Tax=Streptococcus suis TaxID=1307 RepID=UPI001EE8AD8A|nr:terminase [Streptococcus suis]MBS8106276.1 terminase [Streptococcus suis]